MLILKIRKNKRSSSYMVSMINENVIGTSVDISGHDSSDESEDMEETELTDERTLLHK